MFYYGKLKTDKKQTSIVKVSSVSSTKTNVLKTLVISWSSPLCDNHLRFNNVLRASGQQAIMDVYRIMSSSN